MLLCLGFWACQASVVQTPSEEDGGCTKDSDCENGKICNRDTGYCVLESPDGDASDGDEGSDACKIDADCGEGETCEEGNCRTANPADGDEEAARECTFDEDCETGEWCIDGFCEARNPADEDGTDGDKTDEDRDAERPQCVYDNDCLSNQICMNGQCRTVAPDGDAAEADAADLCEGKTCPNLQHCDPETGSCDYDPEHCVITRCDPGSSCDQTTGICRPIDGHCVHTGCPAYYLCDEATGSCYPNPENWPKYCQPCMTENDCDGASCLSDNETQESFCAADCFDGDLCPEGASCVSSGPFSRYCRPEAYTCGNPHNIGGSCQADADCRTGHTCIVEEGNVLGEEWPRGYCSKLCVEDEDCENPYARCESVQDTDGNARYICLHICDNIQVRCREDYQCHRAMGQWQGVCIPD